MEKKSVWEGYSAAEKKKAFDFAAGEQIVNEAPAEETWGKSIAGRYLSPHTVSYDSVSRRVSAGGNNAVSGRAGGTGSTGSNNAGDSSVTDGRSSFFSGRSLRRDSPAAAYAEATADILSIMGLELMCSLALEIPAAIQDPVYSLAQLSIVQVVDSFQIEILNHRSYS